MIRNLLARKIDITVPAGVGVLFHFFYLLFVLFKLEFCFNQLRSQNVLHLVASRTGGTGAAISKLLLTSGAKDMRLAKDDVSLVI